MFRMTLIVCLMSLGCGSDAVDPHDQSAQRTQQRQDAIEQARKDADGKPAAE